MFKIIDKRTFTHDVKVLTPIDGGGFEEEILTTTFNYVPTDETDKHDLRKADGTTAFLQAVVVTFSGLVDESAQPLTCTPEIRERLLFHPNARQALCGHYFKVVTDIKEGN